MNNRTRLATLVRLVAYGFFSAMVAQGCGGDDAVPNPVNPDGGNAQNTGGSSGTGGVGTSGAGTGGTVRPDAGTKVSCGSAAPQCLGDRALRLCSPEGDWVTVPCGTTEKCSAGTCAVTQACTPGEKKCATDGATKVCDKDGSAYVISVCAEGKICTAGDCVLDVQGGECSPGQKQCVGTKTRLTCLPAGKGFDSFDCPATAPCTNGECQGPVCVVGDECGQDPRGRSLVRTCVDGTTLTERACAGTDICRLLPENGRTVGKCVPFSTCTFQGDRVCGSPGDTSVDASKTYSECRFTSAGTLAWTRIDCTGTSTCDPANVGCSTTCLPGETRCSGDGTQLCASDSTWGAVQKCAAGLACRQSAATALRDGGIKPPTAECVERECALLSAGFPGTGPGGPGVDGGFAGKPGAGGSSAGGFGGQGAFGGTFGGGLAQGPATGLCDGNQIRMCSADGKLQAAADCKSGVCKAVSAGVISGYHPGTCSRDCKPGESRCVNDGFPLFVTCSADGTWSTSYQDCKAACTTFVDLDGMRTRLCGDECVPGSTRCKGDDVETCGAGKKWLTAVACTVGRCSMASGTAACMADCVPGDTVCTGTFKLASDGVSTGTAASATCTSKGTLPAAPTACTGTQTCRTSKFGTNIGCVDCLGPNAPGGNDSGLADSRCALQGAGLQKCSAQNAWETAAACGTDMSCFVGSPVACGQCPNVFSPGACTETFLSQQFFQGTCQNFGLGSPRQCGSSPDCCTAACNPTGGGFAFCAPNDFSPCLAGGDAFSLGSTLPQTVNGTTLLGDDTFQLGCSFFGPALDSVYSFAAPQAGTYAFDTLGSKINTVISLLDAVACNEMACNDDVSFVSAQSRIVVPLAAGQRVLVVVEGRGDFVLNVDDVTTPRCGNGFVENSEECDGRDFGGLDCFQATGGVFPGGFLACLPGCSLDVSSCTSGGGVDGGIGGIGGGFGGFAGAGAFGGRPGPGAGGIIFGAGGTIIGPPPPPPPPPPGTPPPPPPPPGPSP